MKQSATITGKVHEIRKEQKFSDKFRKQEVILDLMWDEQRNWTNYRSIEFVNDEINKLTFQEGDVITVDVDVTGNYHEKSDRYFNSDRVFRVEVIATQEQREMAYNLGVTGDDSELPF